MQVLLDQGGDKKDITQFIGDVTWSGDYQQVARCLEINVLYPVNDKNQTIIIPTKGNHVYFYDEGKELFRGIVWDVTIDTTNQFIDVKCYDDLIYLTKSEMAKVYYNASPDEIARDVCSQFNIVPGDIVAPGTRRNYVALGQVPYDVIMAAYTYASKSTGHKYIPIMRNGKLDVTEKGYRQVDVILDSDHNLESAQYNESLDDLVNKVIVYDDKGNTTDTVTNAGWISAYGIVQKAVQYDKDKDNHDIATKLLKDAQQKAEIKAVGDINSITGYKIYIKEPYTKMIGVFYIDGDTHTWKNGVHTMDLVLAFQDIMDEKELEDKLSDSGSDSE